MTNQQLNQQLTLLDISSSQWEIENEDTCEHQWIPSTGAYGLFAWRCSKCWDKKKADIFKDHNHIVKSAQSLKRNFQDYFLQYERAKSDKDKKRFLTAAVDRYWKARIEFLRVAIGRPLTMGSFERDNPCPSELLPAYEMLTQKPPLNEWGVVSEDEVMDTSDNVARGKVDDPDGTLTKITPSKKTRRKRGEGSGHLFSKTVNRKGKTYLQWWFQYEEKLENGDRKKKTVYVPKVFLDKITSMNAEKHPVEDILKALGRKQRA